MTPPPEDIARQLFAAIQKSDLPAVEALYADDLTTWHSFDNRTKNKLESLALIEHFGPAIGRRRYRLVESISTADRVVQRYELTISFASSATECKVNLVIFLSVSDGRVSRIEEYIDSRDANTILAAVEAATAMTES